MSRFLEVLQIVASARGGLVDDAGFESHAVVLVSAQRGKHRVAAPAPVHCVLIQPQPRLDGSAKRGVVSDQQDTHEGGSFGTVGASIA